MNLARAAFGRIRKHALALVAVAGLGASLAGGAAVPATGPLMPHLPGGAALTQASHVETAALVSGSAWGGVLAKGPERQVRTVDAGRGDLGTLPGFPALAAAAIGMDDGPASHLLALRRAGLPAAPSTGPPSLSV